MKQLLFFLTIIAPVACSNSTESPPPSGEIETPMMLPVALQQTLDENCISCHATDGIGPFDFTNAQTVVALGEVIVQSVESRQMPPWNMDPECVDLKGNLRLTEEEISIFSDWLDAGKPLVPEAPFERGVAKSPEVGDPPEETDEVFNLMIPEAYNPVFGRTEDYEEDDFRCFVVDPGFTTDRQLTGFEVLVDNAELAHHMVVFTAEGDADNRAALAALEGADAEPGFSCFGVSGFNVNGIAAVWAPGGGRVGFPRRERIGQTAVEIEAGSLIVIQMHYNKPAADAGTDQSGVRLWIRPENEPIHELAAANMVFVGNLPFRVPAGVDGTMVQDDACDVVYDTFVADNNDQPISPPAVGFAADEVECGIKQEDCEAEFGVGAEQCAINYSVRLRMHNADMAATYTVTIAGVELTYDASTSGATSVSEMVEGIADAINAHATFAEIVTAVATDIDGDGVADEVVVSNLDDAAMVRTESFTATGTAQVSRRDVDKCAKWNPERLVAARSVGASGCVQMDIFFRNPLAMKAWSAFPHMHLIGQRIEAEILRSRDDGTVSTPEMETTQCATRTDLWDFNWQRTYWFEEPKDIPRNGLIRMRCRYDNSGPSTEVRLGDGSNAEMCLALFYLTP